MSICSQCGYDCGDGDKFCSSCGAPLKASPASGLGAQAVEITDPSLSLPSWENQARPSWAAPEPDSVEASDSSPFSATPLSTKSSRLTSILIPDGEGGPLSDSASTSPLEPPDSAPATSSGWHPSGIEVSTQTSSSEDWSSTDNLPNVATKPQASVSSKATSIFSEPSLAASRAQDFSTTISTQEVELSSPPLSPKITSVDSRDSSASNGGGASKNKANPAQDKVEAYLVWSIVSLLCCCPVLGLPALILSIICQSKLKAGDLVGAKTCSQWAYGLNIASLVSSFLVYPLCVLL